MKLSTLGQIIGFLGPLVIMLTTGSVKLGAVHSYEPPRWAHYIGWGGVCVGFFLQLLA